MKRLRLLLLAASALLVASAFAGLPVAASGAGSQSSGTQSDAAYAASGASKVRNIFATTLKTSCYTPEVPYFTNLGPNDGYDGMSVCAPGTPNTGEALGPYPSQAG